MFLVLASGVPETAQGQPACKNARGTVAARTAWNYEDLVNAALSFENRLAFDILTVGPAI
jgi:hypothetical protein